MKVRKSNIVSNEGVSDHVQIKPLGEERKKLVVESSRTIC